MIDDTATTLYPGGILNTGFALSWAKDRVHDALPASPTGGQPWALEAHPGRRHDVQGQPGAAPEAVDLLTKIDDNQLLRPGGRRPARARRRSCTRSSTPVFLACQWTDEQTGGHCPTLASRFTGTPRKWFTFTNGTHIDSLDPATFNRWYDFLELYVAQQAPSAARRHARSRRRSSARRWASRA